MTSAAQQTVEQAAVLWAKRKFTKGVVKFDPTPLPSQLADGRSGVATALRDSALTVGLGQLVNGLLKVEQAWQCTGNKCRLVGADGIIALSTPVCNSSHFCTAKVQIVHQALFGQKSPSLAEYVLKLRRSGRKWSVHTAQLDRIT